VDEACLMPKKKEAIAGKIYAKAAINPLQPKYESFRTLVFKLIQESSN
jgi:hypothetical protein